MARAKSLYGRKGYRPQSVLRRAVGEVRAGGAPSGGSFNNFPAIMRAFPLICGDIVEETIEELAELALSKAPRGETGELSTERKIRIFRKGGAAQTGRVDFTATSEVAGRDRHLYAWYVEVGTVDTPAQPFVVPAIMEMRPIFHDKLRAIESRLPR